MPTDIEWTDETWNPVSGCKKVSAGCKNCYAERVAARFWKGRKFTDVQTHHDRLYTPIRWKKPRMVFVNSMSDLFEESVPFEFIDQVFAVMALTPQHTYQILTKRPERMSEYFNGNRKVSVQNAVDDSEAWDESPLDEDEHAPLIEWPLPNVWLGISVEDQQTADERIPILLQVPARMRFLSAEPMLGPIDLRLQRRPTADDRYDLDGPIDWITTAAGVGLHWIICGGESGADARPMHPDWARTLRNQCQAAGVPFFFKQNGEYVSVYDRERDDPDWRRCDEVKRKHPSGRWLNFEGGHGFHGERVHYVDKVGKKAAGRLLDGREWNEFPKVIA